MLIFLLLIGIVPRHSLAASAPTLAVPTGLAIAEIKITGNEFILLYNNSSTTITDLSKYWLYSFNNTNPLAAGVSSSTQQLPSAGLGVGQTLLLSANGGATCGAAVTSKLSLSLTDSGGFLEIVQTTLVNGILVQTAGDAVSWSSGANSSPGQIANVPSSSADPNGAYYRYKNSDNSSSAAYLWQLADTDVANTCQLNVKVSGVFMPGPVNPGNQLLPGDLPPVTFVEVSEDGQAASPSLPLSDVGLAAPVINEILPNPPMPQTDDEDEFIELYNSNDKPFDLSGFKLQVGKTTLHTYVFPSGTSLQPKSFTVFMSVDTNLGLSNSGGQASLLDPVGNIISQTEVYGTAKEGQAWALGNGKWYWTITATPNAANVISLPTTASTKKTNGSTTKKSNSTTPTKSSAKVKSASTVTPSNSSMPPKATNSSPLHPLVLAAVGLGAVAYAAYEYRHDMANRLYQLRRYRTARQTSGTIIEPTGSGGTTERPGGRQNNVR